MAVSFLSNGLSPVIIGRAIDGAIAEGDLEAWRGPREEPEDLGLTLFGSAGVSSLAAPPITGQRVEYPTVRLRRENLLVFAAEADRPVEIVLANMQIGTREEPMVWEVRDPSNQRVAWSSFRKLMWKT